MLKIYKSVLVQLNDVELKKLTKGQDVSERLENDGKCPDCNTQEWVYHPYYDKYKPYIECLCCGYKTHL